MKRRIIFTLFLILPCVSVGQINLIRLSDEYCDCFKKLKQVSEDKTEKYLRSCLSDKNKLFAKKELSRLFSTAQSQIEFLKEFGGNCEEFIEYSSKTLLKDKKISDQEYTENIYNILSYFSSQSEKGKLPKIVTINTDEVGILYNIFLNKISTDTIFKKGTHFISNHDSLIKYNIRQKHKVLKFSALSKDNKEIKLNLRYWYKPKPESIVDIHTKIGRNFNEIVIIPSISSCARNILRNYKSKDLYLIGKDKLSDLIQSEVNRFQGVMKLFSVNNINVNEIKYPHIVSKAKAANLLDIYKLLESENSKRRLSALDELFNDASETAYLIILNHWTKEKDQGNLNYILERMAQKK